MSKRQMLTSVIILLILCFLCIFIYNNAERDNDNKKSVALYVTETKNCSDKLELYYTDSNGSNYYTYCLNSIVFDFGDRKLELKKALEMKQVSIGDILYKLEEQELYEDGGSILYRDNSKYSDLGVSILKCQTVDGNRDYYIGNKNMTYSDGFCIAKDYSCRFTRTYQILDISESNNELYLYFTLKQFQNDDVVTVKVSQEMGKSIEEDKYYEFTFVSKSKKYDDTIKDIFDNNELIEIDISDKEGLDQIQEKLCIN